LRAAERRPALRLERIERCAKRPVLRFERTAERRTLEAHSRAIGADKRAPVAPRRSGVTGDGAPD
jgi:hypothetical protein